MSHGIRRMTHHFTQRAKQVTRSTTSDDGALKEGILSHLKSEVLTVHGTKIETNKKVAHHSRKEMFSNTLVFFKHS